MTTKNSWAVAEDDEVYICKVKQIYGEATSIFFYKNKRPEVLYHSPP